MRIAVASRSFSRHPVLRAELLAAHTEVTFNDRGLVFDGQALIDFLRGHTAAIVGLERLTLDILRAVPELRLVSKYGVGLDMIDLDAMSACGVKLSWTGGVNCRCVAELTVAFMIALMHRLPEATGAVRAGGWRQIVGRQLSGKTIGIVGCGHVGKDVVRLLRPWDCRILAYDIRDYPEFYREYDVQPVDLDRLLRTSDIVSLHVPLDECTRNILDGDRLARLRPNAVLVNTARGGLVDEAALKVMLEGGRLAGAAFDVFLVEPPPNDDLVKLPNVLATPHIGGSAEEAILAMGRAAIAGLSSSA
jgi:D-3-phosphoglycerate dehydrogenase